LIRIAGPLGVFAGVVGFIEAAMTVFSAYDLAMNGQAAAGAAMFHDRLASYSLEGAAGVAGTLLLCLIPGVGWTAGVLAGAGYGLSMLGGWLFGDWLDDEARRQAEEMAGLYGEGEGAVDPPPWIRWCWI
jgi:hypothetical protein